MLRRLRDLRSDFTEVIEVKCSTSLTLQGILGVRASHDDFLPEPSYPEGTGDMVSEDTVTLVFPGELVEEVVQMSEAVIEESEVDHELMGEEEVQQELTEEGRVHQEQTVDEVHQEQTEDEGYVHQEQLLNEGNGCDETDQMDKEVIEESQADQEVIEESQVDQEVMEESQVDQEVIEESQADQEVIEESQADQEVTEGGRVHQEQEQEGGQVDIATALWRLSVSPLSPSSRNVGGAELQQHAAIPSVTVTSPESTDEIHDPYPTMSLDGPGVFSLPGRNCTITIRPLIGECSVCGRKPKNSWCSHLISAGRKMGMKINVKKPTKVSLTKLQMTQRDQKGKSGGKKPRKRDYREVEVVSGDEVDAGSTWRESLFARVSKAAVAKVKQVGATKGKAKQSVVSLPNGVVKLKSPTLSRQAVASKVKKTGASKVKKTGAAKAKTAGATELNEAAVSDRVVKAKQPEKTKKKQPIFAPFLERSSSSSPSPTSPTRPMQKKPSHVAVAKKSTKSQRRHPPDFMAYSATSGLSPTSPPQPVEIKKNNFLDNFFLFQATSPTEPPDPIATSPSSPRLRPRRRV